MRDTGSRGDWPENRGAAQAGLGWCPPERYLFCFRGRRLWGGAGAWQGGRHASVSSSTAAFNAWQAACKARTAPVSGSSSPGGHCRVGGGLELEYGLELEEGANGVRFAVVMTFLSLSAKQHGLQRRVSARIGSVHGKKSCVLGCARPTLRPGQHKAGIESWLPAVGGPDRSRPPARFSGRAGVDPRRLNAGSSRPLRVWGARSVATIHAGLPVRDRWQSSMPCTPLAGPARQR